MIIVVNINYESGGESRADCSRKNCGVGIWVRITAGLCPKNSGSEDLGKNNGGIVPEKLWK
jgi:hypothetical protein